MTQFIHSQNKCKTKWCRTLSQNGGGRCWLFSNRTLGLRIRPMEALPKHSCITEMDFKCVLQRDRDASMVQWDDDKYHKYHMRFRHWFFGVHRFNRGTGIPNHSNTSSLCCVVDEARKHIRY